MKVVVLGAGALGTIIAGHLAKAGEDVSLIARGDRAKHLNENGITVTGLAEFNIRCPVMTNTKDLLTADALIIAVKTHDMEAALSNVSHLNAATVLSVHNGVHGNELLSKVFGGESVVGTAVYFSGEVLPTGEVSFTVNSSFSIGELPNGSSSRVRAVSEMLQNSGINSFAVDNIQTLEWSKFVVWAGTTAVAVLTQLLTYRFLANPDSALICARVMREVAGVAEAKGIPIVDQPPFPVRPAVEGSEEEAVSALHELGTFFENNAPGHRMSALQDLDHGRLLEIDETLGPFLNEAHSLGIPTPTLETCYHLLRGINQFQ